MSIDTFVSACRDAIGAAHVLTDAHDTEPFLTDWRRRYKGAACAVLRPGSTAEVAALVCIANQHGVALVPQGGNTGLAGGATPDTSGTQAVLSLARLNRVRALDPHNNTITVEAGVILADVQARAREGGRLFALSLAAEGSCTIGGNLSTNAGGTAVLRYGNARELCLGLEVVTPQGEIWDGLRGLRKDNTGYDLRDLFIGAEGTLGIITAAVMKLHPLPAAQVTALAALESPHAALDFLSLAQRAAGPLLTGFELMSDFCMQLVGKHYPQLRYPFAQTHAQTVLLELSDNESETHARALFEKLMEEAFDAGLVVDAVVAENLAQSRAFWDLREHIRSRRPTKGSTSSTTSRCRSRRSRASSTKRTRRSSRPRPARGWSRSAISATATCTTTCRRPKAAIRRRSSRSSRRQSTASCTTTCIAITARSARSTASGN